MDSLSREIKDEEGVCAQCHDCDAGGITKESRTWYSPIAMSFKNARPNKAGVRLGCDALYTDAFLGIVSFRRGVAGDAGKETYRVGCGSCPQVSIQIYTTRYRIGRFGNRRMDLGEILGGLFPMYQRSVQVRCQPEPVTGSTLPIGPCLGITAIADERMLSRPQLRIAGSRPWWERVDLHDLN